MTSPLQPPGTPRGQLGAWTSGPVQQPVHPFIPLQQSAPPAGLEGPLAPRSWAPYPVAPQPAAPQTAAPQTAALRPAAPQTRVVPYVIAGVGCFLLLLVIVGFLAHAVLSGPTAASPTSSSETAPTDAPAVPTQTPGQVIYAWYAGGGNQVINALGTDFRSASAAGTKGSISGMRAACTSLQSDVESAQAFVPIPDAEAHRHFSAALAQYARSAADCLAGISGLNPSLISQATSEITAGTVELDAATTRIQTLAGN